MGNKGLYNDECSGTTGDDTQHEVEADKVTANVFFDGTLNNYFNVKAAENLAKKVATQEEAEANQKHGGDDTSYANDFSNVARMWKGLFGERDGPEPAVYVEGIGTTKLDADSLAGYGAGMGDTGIDVRVDGAFAPLKEKVNKKCGAAGLPALLEINVFGFSRGAAAARLFVHKVLTERPLHFGGTWAKVLLRINFVGLFDTVSSHGARYGNDVAELHLKLDHTRVKRVFQLVALDEYRERFALTTIASAVEGGKGYELHIPGAHSDVGGGYKEAEPETRDLTPTHTTHPAKAMPQTVRGTRDFAYAQGWYAPSDAPDKWWGKSATHSRTVKGDYYRVALSLMVDQAKKHTSTDYPDSLLKPSTYPQIEAVRSALRQFAQSDANTRWVLDEQLGTAVAQAFRHQHLHVSYIEGSLAKGPHFKDDATLERHYESA